MSTADWKVERLAGALGAEILGVDLSRPLDAAERAALRALWLEHGVIFSATSRCRARSSSLLPRAGARRSNTLSSRASRTTP